MWATLPTLDLRTSDLCLSHLSLADGTVNGVLGVVSPITHEQYIFLEKVQDSLAKVVKGVGGLSHSEWRSFFNDRRTSEASAFIDGDLIESFLDLPKDKMEEVPPRHPCSACTIPCYVTAFITFMNSASTYQLMQCTRWLRKIDPRIHLFTISSLIHYPRMISSRHDCVR